MTGATGIGLEPVTFSGSVSVPTNLTPGVVDQLFGYRLTISPWAEGQYVTFADQFSGSTLVYYGILKIVSAGGFGYAFGISTLLSVSGSPAGGETTNDTWIMSFAAAPAGATGPQGSTGPQGPQGPIGATGASGLTGATGPQGPIGATGASGLVGATGPQGPQGVTGATGLTGATGPQGPQGPTGATGASGLVGATGPQGPQGPTGATGLTGSTGPVAGSNTFVIFNDAGAPGGTAGFTFDKTTNAVATTGTVSATGNITGGNINTAGLVSATGSVIGSVIAIPAGALTLTNQGSVNDIIAGTKNVGQVIIGGTTQTGAITVGQSTATQSLSLASGVTSSGNTKTVSVGQSGAAGSTTNITMGPSAGVGTVNIGSGTTMVVANTSATALSVAGTIQGGNLQTAGLISATGNITGGNLSGTAIVGTLTTAAQTNITSVGTLSSLSVSGNVQGGNLRTAGLVSATGAITGAAITGTSLTVSTGNITGGNIVNANANGVGNIGSATVFFNTVFAKATSAQYADLAEMYEADGIIEPGTVVCFGGAKEVTLCQEDACRRVAGVVSTNPSYLMNSGQTGEYVVPVALTGRVPVRVTGSVRKGDMMVAAINGRARAETDPVVGSVIGKALADFDGNEGVIEVVVGRM